jgi:hypothetical protein
MIDMFKTHARSLTSPPEDAVTITPSDAAGAMSHVTRAIYVGAAGDIALLMQSGATVVLRGVPSGSFLPLRVRQVLATGTTADGIVGFW